MARRNSRRKFAGSFAVVLLLALTVVAARQVYVSRPGYGVPYYAIFDGTAKDRWTGFGGVWEVVENSMRNDSNDRGAKLVTGSPNWKDYLVEGDVQLLGEGSVGLLARVSEAEVGEDSFKGYFAGVRAVDNSLVLGAYDFAYHEAAKAGMPEPVQTFRWYHLTLKVEGCQISASAWAAGMREARIVTAKEPECFRNGSIGLRSNGTGGLWRNIRVLTSGSKPASPESSAPHPDLRTNADQQRAMTLKVRKRAGQVSGDVAVPVQGIDSLRFLPPFGSPVASVRGSVVLTRPAIFVQDSTGGVQIEPDAPTPLKIGDEVEATGVVSLDRISPVLGGAKFRLLRESVPLSAVAVTANQVASGSYDGSYVQVEGLLRRTSKEKDGSVSMHFEGGTQSFHAFLAPGRSWSRLGDIALESRLRIRGVSVADPHFNLAFDPFVILVRSVEDVDIVSGPPWWRPSTLILMGLVALGLAFTLNHLFLLAKHWRLRAVAEERERLAHTIHDTLAQSFAGIGFQLQAIRNSIKGDSHVLERHVDLAMLMARTSHEEARRSIATLRPESLGHMGLLSALREYAERMVKDGDVCVETYGEEGVRPLPLRIKDTLFRIGQEAIANSIRHAQPGTIRIRMQHQHSSVLLSVEDDGVGFTIDAGRSGFGLAGMRKRAESISASLVVRSNPGVGTLVEVRAAVGPQFQGFAWLNRH